MEFTESMTKLADEIYEDDLVTLDNRINCAKLEAKLEAKKGRTRMSAFHTKEAKDYKAERARVSGLTSEQYALELMQELRTRYRDAVARLGMFVRVLEADESKLTDQELTILRKESKAIKNETSEYIKKNVTAQVWKDIVSKYDQQSKRVDVFNEQETQDLIEKKTYDLLDTEVGKKYFDYAKSDKINSYKRTISQKIDDLAMNDEEFLELIRDMSSSSKATSIEILEELREDARKYHDSDLLD